MIHPRSLISLLLICLTAAILSEAQGIKFHHISTRHGLSHDHVMSILRDRDGFMWFATEGGLNKYDGYEFTVYRNNPEDKFSISDNFVTDLIEDKNGNLLIGLNTGLERFDRSKNNFAHYDINGFSVRDIFEDSNGNLWLGTNGGLFQFDLEKGIIAHFTNNKADSSSLSDNLIYEITEDNNKRIWIATRNGLNRMDPLSGKFTQLFYSAINPQSISGNITRSVFKDSEGSIWVGTRNFGVTKIDTKGKFTRYYHDPAKQRGLSHNDILSFSEDQKGNIWIGTENGGIDLLNLKTNTFINLTAQKGDDRSLSNPSIHSLYFDKTGNMWVGTYAGGVDLVPKFGDKFIHYRQNPEDENTLSSSNVLSLTGDREGYVWIGTDGFGLNRFDPKTKTFRHFKHDDRDNTTIAGNHVFSISEFDQETMLITYFRAGFDLLDKRTGKCRRFKLSRAPGQIDLFTTSVITGYRENEQHLWLATSSVGLVRFNLTTKTFRHFIPDAKDSTAISGDAITAIKKDHLGNLWFGTSGGLCLYNPEQENFKRFQNIKNDKTSLSHSSVYSLFQDSQNRLWIGTANGGLNLYDYKTRTFKSYTEKNGLANNTIFGIQEDEHGNLWLSTNKGLSRFSPPTGKVRNYDPSDGVQGNQFRFNASYKAPDGQMYFGGTNGFNTFYPDDVTDNTIAPPIKITGFEVFNRPVDPIEPDSPIKESISEAKAITLPYDKTVFTFKFAALSYTVPEKNQFAYRLIGFDKEWNLIGTKRNVTYTNLDPGKYMFVVKGCNNDGVWNESGTSIELIITPPFWMTWWFKTFAVMISAVGLSAFYKYRVRTIEQQKKRLERQVAERTREISAQKEKIESQKESIQEKNSMLEKQFQEITAKNEKIVLQRNKIEDARNEIKKKNEELQKYNSDLESMVRHKTRELEKTFEVLKESNRELDQFIYRSAHDLRGPIASILGLCNLGSMETKDPQMIDLLNKMEYSAEMMARKLARLMKIHEINTLHVKLETIDPKQLIDEIVKEISAEHNCSNINIEIEANHTGLYTDRELLKILLKNVIENSIKYKDSRKRSHYVHIRAYGDTDKTIFSVVDNGIGIPKQEADRVFDLFIVATDSIKGFGIGLYESKIIARKLGGDIKLRYPPSGETEFNITIGSTVSVAKLNTSTVH